MKEVIPGYLISIDNNSLSLTYTILSVSGSTLIIDNTLPVTFTATDFQIYVIQLMKKYLY